MRTVRLATANSWLNVVVLGIRVPGGYWPEVIRARRMAVICSLGVCGAPRSIGGSGVSWSAMVCIVPAAPALGLGSPVYPVLPHDTAMYGWYMHMRGVSGSRDAELDSLRWHWGSAYPELL